MNTDESAERNADRIHLAASTAGPRFRTPFADAVLRLRHDEFDGEQTVSFHALPWSQGRSLVDAGPIGQKYRSLFGAAFLDTEMSYSGGVLDTYFRPVASLDLAQQLAAEAFRADYTFFVTTGTTVANQVGFDALAGPGRRILIDRTAHQSIHVAAGQSSATVEYAPTAGPGPVVDQPLLDVPRLIEMVAAAARCGRPYDAVVLAASSYDGVLYNAHRIMSECLEVAPGTAFLVDEAWAAINAFHPALRRLTALDAARRIRAAGTPLRLLVTHSAHKSMSAARQGSYLHVVGDPPLVARVGSALYGRHTTSPSVPILASLDLARAHAQADGQGLLQRSIDLAARLRRAIADDPSLAAYRIGNDSIEDESGRGYFASDPTKVLIDVTGVALRSDEIRLRLFHDYGVYVSRTVPGSFLVNLHIGITAADVHRLLDALRSVARREHGRVRESRPKMGTDDVIVDRLLIAYPPGVPLAVPGEAWNEQLRQRVEAGHRGGANIYALPADHRHRRDRPA